MVTLTQIKGSSLTEPRGEAFKASVEATHAGMAHFAGTGPEDATCGACTLFKEGLCMKYRELMRAAPKGRSKGGIPPKTPACKYFEAGAKPQARPYDAAW